ncbi:MAG: GGDEF domain-containing protein [Oscillospiraceae bacterium]|nr:GGDEF domain-containing protein [Oscillospiraceae bacterium]
MKDNNTRIGIEPLIKFHLTCFAACLMHITFLITFSVFKMWLLVVFNVFSITLYFTAGIITRKKELLYKHGLVWICLFFAEVVLHAVLCTFVQGLGVAFFLYPMMVMPLCTYYLFIFCEKKVFYKVAAVMVVVTTLALSGVIIVVELLGSVYNFADMHELTRTETVVIRSINILFAFIMAMTFTIIFYLEVTRAFTQLHETNKKLNYIATHDALTGLFNRHSLWKFFEDLEESREHYCIIMGDLDDFKKINDTYGHDCGDIVLKSVAGVILNNVGEQDMACRWGGEEMLIVMRGTRDDCFERLGKIKAEICGLGIVHEEQPVKVTMTFGFAGSEEKSEAINETLKTAELEIAKVNTSRPPSHIGVESLISMVDKRLYVGKRNGKNVIIVA